MCLIHCVYSGSGRRTFVYDRTHKTRAHVSDQLIASENLKASVKVLPDNDILSIPLVGYIHQSGGASLPNPQSSSASIHQSILSSSEERPPTAEAPYKANPNPVYFKTSNEGLSSVMKQIEIIYNIVRSVNRYIVIHSSININANCSSCPYRELVLIPYSSGHYPGAGDIS